MDTTEITFNYYYGDQANQFSFYRIPKSLFTDSIFSGLSSDAKVLYGLMLDRMSLSLKNDWKDEQNLVFIYFTLNEVQDLLNCGHSKGVQLLAELDSEKGIGLIERVKQGMGRPSRIYVKNFIRPESTPDIINCLGSDSPKAEVMTSEKQKSLVLINGGHDFRKTESIKTDNNQNELNKTEKKDFNLSIHKTKTIEPSKKQMEIDRWMEFGETFKKNIDYEILMQRDPDTIPEILEIMIDAACSKAKSFRINGSQVSAERVRERLLSLNSMHIEYVLDALTQNTSKVQNIRSYLLATLYNATKTINTYYQSRVNHDLYGKQKQGC